MKAHIIENGVVVNTIMVDSLDAMPNLVEAVEGGIGYTYVDGQFIPPVDSTPVEEKEARVRLTRDMKLAQSDYLVTRAIENGELVSQEIKDYRQALRDITIHPDFPDIEIDDFPTLP
jgi:hypothetical protein